MKITQYPIAPASAVAFLLLLSGDARADLLTATETETACPDVAARKCSASGSVPWRLPRMADVAQELTGDWQWQVTEGNLDGLGGINDIQITAGRHPQVHKGEGPGPLLTVNFFDIDFAPQTSKSAAKQHILGGHADSLVAAIVADGTKGMKITVELRHPSVVVIPEPSTLMLLSAVVVGLIGYGWRRRRAEESRPLR